MAIYICTQENCCQYQFPLIQMHFAYIYYRLSEELDDEPIETFHKSLDLGERLFIEKFLALETSI